MRGDGTDDGDTGVVAMRRAHGWAYVALLLAGTVVVAALPPGPWPPAAEVCVHILGAVAVVHGLRRNRPVAVLAWRLLAAALAAFAVSSAAEAAELAGLAPGVTGAVESGLDVAGYAAMLASALAALVTGRGRANPGAWTDTATLLLAAGLAVATFLDGPGGPQPHQSELTLGLPLLAAVVVVAGVRVALPGNGRSVSGVAICVAGVLALSGWALQLSTTGEIHPAIGCLPLLADAAVALAANHPSSRHLGRPAEAGAQFTAGRVIGLGAALLVSPALVLLWTVRNGGNGYLLGGGIGVLTALALWRLGRLDAERHRAQSAAVASEARLRVLLENAADVIAIVDAAGRVTYVSPAVGSLLGLDPADVLGHRALAVVDPDDRGPLLRALTAAGTSTTGGVTDTDVRLRHADGTTRWVEAKVSGRVNAPGVEGWVVDLREVTDRKLLEEELRHRAGTDALTGLVNRAGFWQRLTRATADLDPASPPAVLFVDLDGFKAVNDTLGHAAGDQLLVAVAGRLTAAVRTGDCVARLGGDEFAVLLGTADDARVRWVADRLLQRLREPVGLDGSSVTVTASVGGTLAVAGDTPESLLHRADTAMYAAKRDGKDGVELLTALDPPQAVCPSP